MAETAYRRHGTRIRAQIPLRITSLEPGERFSERCHTLLVNEGGCSVRLPRALKPGMRVRVEELPCGMAVTAHVACNQPLSEEKKFWLVGLGLDVIGNLWRIAPAPADWQATA